MGKLGINKMKKYYSKNSNKLLHIVYKSKDILSEREDIAPADKFIQVSSLKLSAGKTFRPHKHIWKNPSKGIIIAQESWCVVSGEVLVSFYDIDDTLIDKAILSAGDISLTFEGGHTYEILKDAIIYEYKTGPYEGQKLDKVFIDEK